MRQTRSAHAGLVLWLAVVVTLLVWARLQWPQQNWLATDFQTLLPHTVQDPWVERANAAATASFDRQLLWLVEGQDRAAVDLFSAAVTTRLQEAGFTRDDFEAEQVARWRGVSQALYPYRWGLLSPQDRAALAADSQAYLQAFQRLLYSPLGAQYLSALERDPTGHFGRFITSLAPPFPTHSNVQTATGVYARLGTGSVVAERLGFDSLDGLYLLFQDLREEAALRDLTLSMTGVPLYSSYGVVSAKREMSSIGVASLLLLTGLLVWALRSVAAVALTLVCVSVGVLGGLAVTVAVLQQIHILTLVFGATLIGIAADYALHYFSHSLLPQWTRAAPLGGILKGLVIGMLTSVLAFSALVFLPFPGIRQIGLFMASGLLCSFVTVCLVFPVAFRRASMPPALPAICGWRPRRWAFAPRAALAVILMAALALVLLVGKDDVRDFYAAPTDLNAAEQAIQRYTGIAPDSRYLLVQADNKADLLEAEQRVADQLYSLQQQGHLADFSGITQMIPAESVQRENVSRWRAVQTQGVLASYLSGLGFSAGLAAATQASLEAEYVPVDLDILQPIDLPLGTGGFLGCDEHSCASWLRLGGVTSVTSLEALADANSRVSLIDPIARINTGIERYRYEVGKMLVFALVLAVVLLGLLCGWKKALRIVSLPLLACVSSLLLLGVVTGSYSIINLMALLLVFGVGFDYAIFRAFTRPEDQGATTLAIALSAVTSILAFGMLALSNTPAISSFGQTITLGLGIAYSLSWVQFEYGTTA